MSIERPTAPSTQADQADQAGSIFETAELTRRRFLGAAAGTLIVGFAFPLSSRAATYANAARPGRAVQASLAGTSVTGWVKVAADERVTVAFGGAEMGQGISTGLAQGVAEELMVDWSAVRIEAAPAAQSYITGGSSAIRFGLEPMRLAGAQAREMLIAAVAQLWGVNPSQCTAAHGIVTNTFSNDMKTYGEVAGLAASMPLPANPALTPKAKWRILGTSAARADIPAKVTGAAVYGIDVMLPNMVFAAVKHGPAFGAKLKSKPAKPSGAIAVVALSDAVAVVADNTWKAMQLSRGLNASWTTPADAADNTSAAILAKAKTLLASGTPIVAEKAGAAAAAIAGAAHRVTATYRLPYLAHAYMEVLNCTVDLTASSCDIWVPTQAPSWVVDTVTAITGLPAGAVTVHVTLMGGGLGRKIEQDYVAQAVRVAKAIGRPVKLTWPREEDFGRDQYRPMALAKLSGGLDAKGNVVGWKQRLVTPSILTQRGWVGPNDVDGQAVDGAIALPYALGDRLVEYVRHPATIPVGFWRSVGNSLNVFMVESMLDELAHAGGMDPVAFRRRLLAGSPRLLKVLNAAATLGKWGTALPAGHARGVAMSFGFGSIVAEVVEISRPNTKTIRVHKAAVAVDCGTAVNPDQIRAQMEGGVAHGMGAALWGEVTFTNGRSNVRNFNNYRMVRMSEMPVVSVKIIESGEAIGGIGEVAVPPVAPAIANAYFGLTGKRVRTLPFFPGSGMGDG